MLMRRYLAIITGNIKSLCTGRVAKRQKMSPNLICGSKKCPHLYRMFDTIFYCIFIGIFIDIKVIIRYYLAVANFVTLTPFSHAGLLSANKQS